MYACTSHAVFSPPAIDRLSSGVFEEVIVTNTIPLAPVRVSRLSVVTNAHGEGACNQRASSRLAALTLVSFKSVHLHGRERARPHQATLKSVYLRIRECARPPGRRLKPPCTCINVKFLCRASRRYPF